MNFCLDVNKDSEGKDQGNSYGENPSQQQRKDATKIQKSQQQQQQQQQQQSVSNDKSSRERERDRQKEFEKEAEREKERLREKEIKAFREFSTLLPFKQSTVQQPRRLPGSSYLNTPDLDPIDDHLVPSSSSNSNNVHNSNYNSTPNNNNNSNNNNNNSGNNINNGGTGSGFYPVVGHINLGPLGETNLASNLIHNTGGRLRHSLGTSGVPSSTPLGISSINRPQIPSIQIQQSSHNSSQQNLNSLISVNNLNNNMPQNQAYRQQPLGQIPHQNSELSPSSTQIGLSSKYKENHNFSQNNDNNNSTNNLNNINSINLVEKEHRCIKISTVQSNQNNLGNSGNLIVENKNIQNGISPRKGDVNYHFESELSNNNHVSSNASNNIGNSSSNNNNNNSSSSSSTNPSSHLEPLESIHAPQTLPQIHGRDSNPDINIAELKIPSLAINNGNQIIRNNGNNNQHLLNSRHNSNSNMSLNILNTPNNRNNDKEKERNDLKISNNGVNSSNFINSGRGAKISGNRNQNHSQSQDKQNVTQKHR